MGNAWDEITGKEDRKHNRRVRGADVRHLRNMEAADAELISELRGILDKSESDLSSWFNNDFARELMSPSYASRVVATEGRAIDAGTQAQKRSIGERGAALNLGKGFTARQEFQAGESGRLAKSASAGRQERMRQQFGHQMESSLLQGKGALRQTEADIEGLEHGLDVGRSEFNLSSQRQNFAMRRQAAANSLGGQIGSQIKQNTVNMFDPQYHMGMANQAAGIAGSFFGLGGMMGGGMGGGMAGMGAGGQAPQVQGFNPFMGYAYGQSPMGGYGAPPPYASPYSAYGGGYYGHGMRGAR